MFTVGLALPDLLGDASPDEHCLFSVTAVGCVLQTPLGVSAEVPVEGPACEVNHRVSCVDHLGLEGCLREDLLRDCVESVPVLAPVAIHEPLHDIVTDLLTHLRTGVALVLTAHSDSLRGVALHDLVWIINPIPFLSEELPGLVARLKEGIRARGRTPDADEVLTQHFEDLLQEQLVHGG